MWLARPPWHVSCRSAVACSVHPRAGPGSGDGCVSSISPMRIRRKHPGCICLAQAATVHRRGPEVHAGLVCPHRLGTHADQWLLAQGICIQGASSDPGAINWHAPAVGACFCMSLPPVCCIERAFAGAGMHNSQGTRRPHHIRTLAMHKVKHAAVFLIAACLAVD